MNSNSSNNNNNNNELNVKNIKININNNNNNNNSPTTIYSWNGVDIPNPDTGCYPAGMNSTPVRQENTILDHVWDEIKNEHLLDPCGFGCSEWNMLSSSSVQNKNNKRDAQKEMKMKMIHHNNHDSHGFPDVQLLSNHNHTLSYLSEINRFEEYLKEEISDENVKIFRGLAALVHLGWMKKLLVVI